MAEQRRPFHPGFVDIADEWDIESQMSSEEYQRERARAEAHRIREPEATRGTGGDEGVTCPADC